MKVLLKKGNSERTVKFAGSQTRAGGGASALGQEVRGRSSKLRLVSLVAEQWRKVMEVGRRPSGECD